MNKKTKNRNKQNKPNTKPPQKIIPIVTKPISEVESSTEDKQSEKVCDERVPEIIKENLTPVNIDQELEKDTPKKPKRNKNKKNQNVENVQDNKQSEVIREEKIYEYSQVVIKQSDVVEDEKICKNLQIENIEDSSIAVTEPIIVDLDIVPTTRKKRNKKKKNINKHLDTPTTFESEVIPKVDSIMPSITNISNNFGVENSEKQLKSDNENKHDIKSKKRNKKRKKRNDSEKSDIPSSFEFQHPDSGSNVISEHTAIDSIINIPQVIDLSTDLSETTHLEINTTQNMENTDEKEFNTIKYMQESLKDDMMRKGEKRNKITEKELLLQKELEVMPNQKSPSKIAQTTSEILNVIEKSNQTKKNEELEKPLQEKSPKLKAEIANPVKKCTDIKDEKCHKEEDKNITIEALTTIDTVTSLPVNCLNETEELPKIESTLCDLNIQELINNSAELIVSDKMTTQEDISGILKLNTNSEENLKESRNLYNIKPQTELSFREIETSFVKPEEVEGSVSGTSPDIIEYPRSSSEHVSDLNNNTIIEEILTTQNLKSNAFNIPIVTNFTEIVEQLPETSNTNKIEVIEEKTIKSKVIEVNQDMQDLKMSIEKSLAELTALEQSEKNTENQLVVKKQDIQTIKTEINEKSGASSDHSTILDSTNIKTSIKKVIQEGSEIKVEIPSEFELGKQTLLIQQISTGKKDQSKCNELKITENVDKKHNIVMEVGANNVQPSKAPICPARKDNKGKSKSRKKDKQGEQQNVPMTTSIATHEATQHTSKTETKQEKNQTKTADEKHGKSGEKGKQQSYSSVVANDDESYADKIKELTIEDILQEDYEPIENFEDALSMSIDDVNKTFELIANEIDEEVDTSQNPEINIIAPDEESSDSNKDEKNPVPKPKNLLGHPNIPVQSNKADYKKERNKTPNTKQAKVNIKDSVEIENKKKSKESQTDNKRKPQYDKAFKETVSCVTNGNEEYVYKYSFRKVFLPNACHVCKIELKKARVPCSYCNLVFYCNQKHKNEDWSQHQALCFAVSTVAHLKGHKHIYADSKGIVGHNYRLLRMQMIIACEKVLKRKLSACEQEALLYPRICVDTDCREWHQSKLKDCDGCGQVSYCSNYPNHLPKSHQRWCNSYGLYQKLVCYQQTKGKLEPKLPTRVMEDNYTIPEKMNEVLASMYEEKIDMNDMQYAALTQLATAPLTAAYSYQISREQMNLVDSNKIKNFTLHVVGVELQFEADVLSKWEIFFLHLQPSIKELRVVMISKNLNSCNLPLDLLGKIQLCNNCTQQKRRVIFDFQDKNYFDYWTSDDYVDPQLVCAFNANIQRSSVHNGKDPWPSTINCVLKSKVPFLVSSYTLEELRRDAARIQDCASIGYEVLSEPKINLFASVRPDRNFISDDEMPLLFKNYNYYVFRGVN